MGNGILCAVDESDAAAPVLDTGRWLAEALGTELVVVHVIADEDDEAGQPAGGASIPRVTPMFSMLLTMRERDDIRPGWCCRCRSSGGICRSFGPLVAGPHSI
jgi:hypothetical protein